MEETILKPNAPVLTLGEFFSKSYSVPLYQRSYSWGEEQIGDLLSDLREFVNSQDQFYFLGQVIVSTANGPEMFELVDGQQRSTTLMLLLTALFHRFPENDPNNEHPEWGFWRSELKQLLQFATPQGEIRPKVKVPSHASDLVTALIDKQALPPIDGVTRENLKGGFDFITSFLDEHWPSSKDIPTLYKRLADGLCLVRLELTTHAQAVAVFEKINNRGLALDSADIIKNILFQEIDDDDYEVVADRWDKASADLHAAKVKRLRSMEFLLRAKNFELTGTLVSASKVREDWKERLENAEKVLEFSKELPKWAKQLRNIGDGKSPSANENPDSHGSHVFRTVQHAPILLSGSHLSTDSFKLLAQVVEERIMISLLARERPQDFEKLVPNWAKTVAALDPATTKSDILKGLIHEKDLEQGLLRLKTDIQGLLEDANSKIASLRYANASDRKRIRYVLAKCSRQLQIDANEPMTPELSKFLETSRGKGNKHVVGFDLDHIRPQSKYGDNPLTDSIGNLVLVHPGDQRAARDAEPIDKSVIYGQSNLLLTKLLTTDPNEMEGRFRIASLPYFLTEHSLTDWSDQAIQSRTSKIQELFNRTVNIGLGLV